MPARKKSIETLELEGTYRADRHGVRGRPPGGLDPLGNPPRHLLGKGERAAWRELAASLPWLTRADRHLVELVAVLVDRAAHRAADGEQSRGAVGQLSRPLGGEPGRS